MDRYCRYRIERTTNEPAKGVGNCKRRRKRSERAPSLEITKHFARSLSPQQTPPHSRFFRMWSRRFERAAETAEASTAAMLARA